MRKIKHKRALFAVACLLLLGGTAAAVLYSNTLSGDVVLVSQYPIELSWDTGDIYESNAFCEITYVDDLYVANQHPSEDYELYIYFQIEAPSGFVATDMYLGFAMDEMVLIDQGGDVWLTGHGIGIVLHSNSKFETISLMFELTAPTGSYTLTVWADTVAP